MISQQSQTRTKDTQVSSKGSPEYSKKNEKKVEKQSQNKKYYLFKQEICQVKKYNEYKRVLLNIWFEDQQGFIVYKTNDKQKFQISCNKIIKVLLDSKKNKIIFNQKIKHSKDQKDNQLGIKFYDQDNAEKCKKELQNYINKKNKDLIFQQEIRYKKELMIKQQPKSLKCEFNQEKSQKQAIQETNQKLAEELEILTKKSKKTEQLLSETLKKLEIQFLKNNGISQRLGQFNQKEQIIQKLTIKVEELQLQINKKTKQVQMEMKQKMALKMILNEKQIKQQQSEQTQITELQKRNEQLETIKAKLQILQKKNQEWTILKVALQTEIGQLKQKQAKYKQIESNYQNLLKKHQILQKKCKLLVQQSQKREILKQLSIPLQQYQKLQQAYSDMKYLHIFEGPVLENHVEYKQFLKETIEKFTKRIILKTIILYKLDKKSNTNFHNYIDGHQNFVVIAKTIAGVFLAGFSQSYVKSKQVANRGGLILSLTNYRVFELIKKMRSVTYDDYYMIFGNSEIRIKSQDNKVFSNFGTTNGYYNAQGESINILLGEGTARQAVLEGYEFHKVIFQNQ